MAIYMFGLESLTVGSAIFITTVAAAVCITSSTYLYCLLSESVTSELASAADAFYLSNWYKLPLHQEKLFVIPIRRAQKDYRMSGLGLVECSLGVFSSVWIILPVLAI